MFGIISEMIRQIRNSDLLISPESNLRYELGLTSLDMMMLIVKLEEECNVNLSVDRIVNVKTVADLVAMVESAK